MCIRDRFYGVHQAHVQMQLRYAGATVVRDALPPRVVQAYRAAWGGTAIAEPDEAGAAAAYATWHAHYGECAMAYRAQVVLSLIRLPPNPERLASAVGSEALSALT